MKRERVVIAIFAFALILGIVWLDWRFDTHAGSLVVITLVGAFGLAELYGILTRIGLAPDGKFGVGAIVLLLGSRGVLPWLEVGPDVSRSIVMGLFSMIIVAPFVSIIFTQGPKYPKGREEFDRAAATLLGLLYVWVLLSFLLELRLVTTEAGGTSTIKGLYLVLILVFSVKLGDSFAYLVGRTIGSTPFSWVSPKKTWEGAAASVLGAAGVAVLLGLLLGFVWWRMLIFGVVTNSAGQLGDLVESLFKRRSGMKDSGTLLREIGGFLDLLDSLLFAAPVAYLLVLLLGV